MKKEHGNQKNVFFGIGVFSIVLLSVGCVFFVWYQKNKTIEVSGVVTELLSSNMIVADDEGVSYLLPNENEYQVGDQVFFEMKDLDDDGEMVEGEVVKIETISKSVQFEITDVNESNSFGLVNDGVEDGSDSLESESVSDEDVVAYFSNFENEVQNADGIDISTTLKNGFVTIIDFLFYDGKIKGRTFSELSDEAKLKVLKLAFSIDSKIEEKFPGYKEGIKETGTKTYTNIKAKVIEKYLDISIRVCENNPNLCVTAKDGLRDLKTNFSLTWSFIKEISGVGVSKLKSWYEVWRESE